jgi:O-antigen/teichoic acid export membrane protein
MGAVLETDTVSWAKRGLAQGGLALWSTTTARQGVLSLVDQGVVSATNFLTGVIIGRACSKEELGLYMLGFSLILLVTGLQTTLICTPYMVYAPRLKGSAHALYTGSTLLHQLALSVLIVVGLASGAFVVASGVGPVGLGHVMWALVAVSAFIMLRDYARGVCFARLHMKAALLIDGAMAGLQVGGLLLLAHFHLLSASRAYWLVGIASGVVALGWLVANGKVPALSARRAISDFRRNWSFGKWLFLSGLVWTISMNLYPWLLAAFHGTASAGIWAACLGVAAIGNPAVLGVQNFLGPKIAHVYAEEGGRSLRRFVFRASLASALPMSFFGLAMMFWGDRLVTLLYGHQYGGNGSVVAILAWSLAVSAVALSSSRALLAIERADLDFVGNFVGLILMITLGLTLVRSFSILGAALGLLLANTAASGVRAFAFVRRAGRQQGLECNAGSEGGV